MITKRPYIECPLEAALAAKHHGFKFENEYMNRAIEVEDFAHFTDEYYRDHLTKESLSLLQPKIGDMYFWISGEGTPWWEYHARFIYDNDTVELAKCALSKPELKSRIIQRNNQPFPKIEYEDVE